MKLTTEQKAFRDFGMALGELKRARKEIVYNLEYYRGLKRNEAIFVFRKRLCERNKLIRDAWQKRAVCRVERNCSTCGRCVTESTPLDEYESFCKVGITTLHITDTPDDFCCTYWEPRKDGE